MPDRNLTDEDIAAIVDAFKIQEHQCRFPEIEPGDLREAIKFYKHYNEMMAESGTVIRKTILVIGIGGLLALLGMGAITKIKSFFVLP